jgi:hypothetical protein
MSYISKFKLKDATGNTVIANVVDRVAQDSIATIKPQVLELQTKIKEITYDFSYNSSNENLKIIKGE